MCTLTWWRGQDDSYGVFFNRDEKKDRPIADPPSVRTKDEVSFLSPRDPRAGGTWMLVNEHGVIVCLLNKWHVSGGSQANQSRGQLVLEMAAIRELKEAQGFLKNLGDYPPFSLFVMDGQAELSWEWNGELLTEHVAEMPMTSSSYRYEEVKIAREEKFAEGLRVEAYHAAKGQKSSAFTVRMCRPDAQTWSRSQVTVGENIIWKYLAESPDLIDEPVETILHLERC